LGGGEDPGEVLLVNSARELPRKEKYWLLVGKPGDRGGNRQVSLQMGKAGVFVVIEWGRCTWG